MLRAYHVPARLRIAIAICGLLIFGSARSARADGGYRLPMTISDLAGGAAFAGGVQIGWDTTPGLALTVGGATVAALGAPILHGAEGNYGRMTASIILRAGLPAIGTIVGMKIAPEGRDKFRSGYGLAGFMIGYVVVTIVDIAMASHPDDPASQKPIAGFVMRF